MSVNIFKVLADSDIVNIDGRAWAMVPIYEGMLDELHEELEKMKALEAQKQ